MIILKFSKDKKTKTQFVSIQVKWIQLYQNQEEDDTNK